MGWNARRSDRANWEGRSAPADRRTDELSCATLVYTESRSLRFDNLDLQTRARTRIRLGNYSVSNGPKIKGSRYLGDQVSDQIELGFGPNCLNHLLRTTPRCLRRILSTTTPSGAPVNEGWISGEPDLLSIYPRGIRHGSGPHPII
jgi:hypothetical protein